MRGRASVYRVICYINRGEKLYEKIRSSTNSVQERTPKPVYIDIYESRSDMVERRPKTKVEA